MRLYCLLQLLVALWCIVRSTDVGANVQESVFIAFVPGNEGGTQVIVEGSVGHCRSGVADDASGGSQGLEEPIAEQELEGWVGFLAS